MENCAGLLQSFSFRFVCLETDLKGNFSPDFPSYMRKAYFPFPLPAKNCRRKRFGMPLKTHSMRKTGVLTSSRPSTGLETLSNILDVTHIKLPFQTAAFFRLPMRMSRSLPEAGSPKTRNAGLRSPMPNLFVAISCMCCRKGFRKSAITGS